MSLTDSLRPPIYVIIVQLKSKSHPTDSPHVCRSIALIRFPMHFPLSIQVPFLSIARIQVLP